MTDTTLVTEDDAREMHEWCDAHAPSDKNQTPMAKVIRHLRATVPRPPKPLADELLELADLTVQANMFGSMTDRLRILADRAEDLMRSRDKAQQEAVDAWEHAEKSAVLLNVAYTERDEAMDRHADDRNALAEARGEVERLLGRDEARKDELHKYREIRKNQRREIARLNEKVALLTKDRTVTPRKKGDSDLGDPADAQRDEVWLVADDQGLSIGIRFAKTPRPWCLIRLRTGTVRACEDKKITLVDKLVLRTRRVVYKAEGLDALPVGSVVLDGDGDAWQKLEGGSWNIGIKERSARYLIDNHGPVTLVHEPMVDRGERSGSDS